MRKPWTLVVTGVLAVVVFVVAAVVVRQFLGTNGPVEPNRPSTRPDTNPTGGYSLDVSIDNGPFGPVTIGSAGENCENLEMVADAYRTCLVATNLVPSIIGGEAYGQLNFTHTPAHDALVWRARADNDSGVCSQGGLEGVFLADCLEAALDPSYEYTAANLRIKVPIGGASS